ncbi:MAG: hypothetical protein U5J63_10970 [Fodinibius sp.]|nr:hypothetical protein [Fodinibius sp.]
MAHGRDINISPLVGPSSILLALMGSGFNGQQFTFHGYLPIDENKRQGAIQKLEQQSKSSGGTQIFMEAPHRNRCYKGRCHPILSTHRHPLLLPPPI